MDRIGAVVWATGHAGRVIVEAGLTRPWLEFRGGIVYDGPPSELPAHWHDPSHVHP